MRATDPLPIDQHIVVGLFQDVDAARRAVEALREAGVPESATSLLSRDDPEARETMGLEPVDDDDTVIDEVGGVATKRAVVGAAVGGMVGLLAGALSFAIPGIGPVVGTGFWAAALASGLGAGATLGLMVGGMRKMWEMMYRDAVAEGRVLVSVHSDDSEVVERAEAVLRRMHPLRLDHFDEGGELTHEFWRRGPTGR